MSAPPSGVPTHLPPEKSGIGATTGHRPDRRHTAWTDLIAALWPLQRTILLGCLGAAVAVIAGMFWYRQWSNGVLAEIGSGPLCRGPSGSDAPDCQSAISEALFYRLRTPATALQVACAALTAGGGALLGVSAFARDFEQRTQVFLLTQSVSRMRWWTARVTIAGVPWVVAMVPLGAAATLSLRTDALYLGDGMDPARFYFSPWSLPLVGLVALCAGATVSIFLRTTLGALLVAALLTTLVVVGSEVARPHLVPTTRLVSQPDVYALGDAPDGSWLQGTGYLDAQGNEVLFTYACPSPSTSAPTPEESDQWLRDCLSQSGIVAGYTDIIEPRWFVPLRLLWSGLLVAISTLVLLAGLLRVRRRIL